MKTTTNAALGITEWELSNGLKVVIRPTTFKEDEVLFGAVSPGGTSLAQDADIVPAQTAVQVVTSLGVGRFASGDLRQALTGKVATVRPVISTYGEGLTGGGSRKDLETIFQLIYLTVTQPRRDPIIFNSLRSSLRSALANQAATPDFAFASALTAALSQDHPRVRPVTPQTVEAMNMDRSIAFYKDRFADASDFTFIFTGSVDAGALKPLAEQYLASLPSIRRRESWKDVGIRPPAGVVERRVEKGTEQKSRAVLVFTGPMRYDTTQTATLRAMTEVLQTRLRDALREDLAGTYVVTATVGGGASSARGIHRHGRIRRRARTRRGVVVSRLRRDRALQGRGPDAAGTGQRQSRAPAGVRNQQPPERLRPHAVDADVRKRRPARHAGEAD